MSYTTVRAPRGKLVHAIAIDSADKTVCGETPIGWCVVPGRRRGRWLIVPARLTCEACKAEIFYPVKESRAARALRVSGQ